ncbi:MFS transporter [Glycomyces arizonensis]|uniref:MFS transporter n=1 Tax=Glycomyces arizonensis TaxID=256035 RepID=UPI00041597F3|nr:MFS transporter [Glycomyces arizonensis]
MRKWWPLTAVCLGAFMLLVDVTIVVVALPDMGEDLEADFTGLQWVIDGYALALAALLLTIGSLADRWGLKRTYLVGLAAFTAASLSCGLATSAGALVAARAAQGAAAAAMFASAMALLNIAYRGKDRAVAFGVWGAVNGAAAAAGPVLGGLLTDHFGWQAIFLVNIPIGVIAIALSAKVLRESRHAGAGRFDTAGAALFTAWAVLTTYALIHAGEHGWTDGGTLVPALAGSVALIAFVLVERRRRAPMLDLRLFARPAFTGAMVAALLVSIAAFAYTIYTSLWLQGSLGLDPVDAGLAMLPMSGAALVTSAALARPLHKVPPWTSIGAGLALIGAGGLLQSGLDADSSWTSLTLGLTVTGLGVGLCLPVLNAAAMSAVPPERGGMASGALNTARQIGMALGIAALGTVFTDGLAGGSFAEPGTVATALNRTMVTAGAVGLAGAVLTAVLISRRPKTPASQAGNQSHQTRNSVGSS